MKRSSDNYEKYPLLIHASLHLNALTLAYLHIPSTSFSISTIPPRIYIIFSLPNAAVYLSQHYYALKTRQPREATRHASSMYVCM
ncbi:hypothetical protein F4777DRAFT_564900 [Nemania sp. FL0916]|nr:hypothetical protein F4777DRAFT_564900 [Nemania sp. FL0916]